MDIFKAYATSPALEREGKDCDFGDVTFKIARSGGHQYNEMLTKRFEAFKHMLDLKDTQEQRDAAEERSLKIMAEVMAHTVLLGWTGNVAFKGETLAYSKENAQMLLEVKEFQNEIAKKAHDYRIYRFATEEADAKNSPTTSSGTSPGAANLSISTA